MSTASAKAKENKSTGPRTEAGKAASSRNAFKHGLASSQLIIAGENQADFDALHSDFVTDFAPSSTIEAILIHNLAKFQWLTDRAIRLQAAVYDETNAKDFYTTTTIPAELALLIRYQTTNHRAFMATLKSVQALQKARKSAPQEFVSQTASEPPAAPPEIPALLKLYMQEKGITDLSSGIDAHDLADFLARTA